MLARPRPPVAIIAHRGARAFAPENTIEALIKAAELGADAVEIDVQHSANRELVVVHDDDLVRCSNVRQRFPERAGWEVCSFSLEEIGSLDAGSWFVEQLRAPGPERQPFLRSLTDDEIRQYVSDADLARYASGEVRVPTLAECVSTCGRLGLALNIELKTIPRFYPFLAEMVVDEVHRSGAGERVVISSFDHQQLGYVRRASRTIRTAVLTSDRIYRPAEYLARLEAHAYHPGCNSSHDTIGFSSIRQELDRHTIDELRTAGYDVNVWTENDPARMAALVNLGVTGIFTDYPNRLAALLGRS
jgi:glycerophosphoryl diester phosphodiesterase